MLKLLCSNLHIFYIIHHTSHADWAGLIFSSVSKISAAAAGGPADHRPVQPLRFVWAAAQHTGRLRSKCQQGGAPPGTRALCLQIHQSPPHQHLQCRHWPGRGPATHVTMMPMIMTFTRESTDKIKQISACLFGFDLHKNKMNIALTLIELCL